MRKGIETVALVGLVVLAGGTCQIGAQEDEIGWSDTAELSYVATSGNAESSSLGFKNLLARRWEDSRLEFRAGGVRVATETESATAFGIPTDFSTVRVSDEETTAESYFANGRYDREITEKLFWYAGAGWERNRFAGIENRYGVQGGLGNIWFERDDMAFRTDYAVTYTDEETVAGIDDSFAGVRFSWDYWNQLMASTKYQNKLVVDESLDETDDLRADMINALTVTMNSRLALQVSLQAMWDNMPALEAIPLVGPSGQPTVLVEVEELDTIFTTSLVVNFK
jgi:putative salt-induced outer membrane protein